MVFLFYEADGLSIFLFTSEKLQLSQFCNGGVGIAGLRWTSLDLRRRRSGKRQRREMKTEE